MAMEDAGVRLAYQRFGFGAKPGARAATLAELKIRLLKEISPDAARLAAPDLPSTARAIQLVAEVEERQRERRLAARQLAANPAPMMEGAQPGKSMEPNKSMEPGKSMEAGKPPTPPPPDPDALRFRDFVNVEARARIDAGVAADIGFAERWVEFWSNHFCVATRRGRIISGIVGAYEREAIRAHAFGMFADMLRAVETHPAMLHYLDQRQSIGPTSPAGQRQKKGLNENLAREILELHTLGVGGGYTQADVTNFAKVLTGWSVSNFEENIDGFGGFFFAPNRHEPGAQLVLGKNYTEEGKEQGLAVLRDLARHPSTAKFITRKLARHFVADAPPPALVARLEQDFRRTGGDLASLARVLIQSGEAWTVPQVKLRKPYEFLIASLRATGEKSDRVPAMLNALNMMGQPLWNPPGPNGHPDDEASLMAPKAIKTRLEFAVQVARQVGNRIDPRELADHLYGAALSQDTKQAIARAETKPQGLALLLMSPEFQRR